MAEVAGVQLASLEESLRLALYTYQEMSDGLKFDYDSASQLDPTPDRPNSARSLTDVTYLGKRVCGLYVIAFKPEDGTGALPSEQTSDDRISNQDMLTFGDFIPRQPKSVPRSKRDVAAEVIMPLISQDLHSRDADPELFGGTYELLGLIRTHQRMVHVTNIGQLGQNPDPRIERFPKPLAMYTVGYHLDEVNGPVRFGDPHAVMSTVPNKLQVCAFMAIAKSEEDDLDLLLPLQPENPRDLVVVL